MVIPDAFRNPFQKMPLDHDTDDFYANRSEAVDARLDQIEGADDAELGEMIRDRWVGGAGNSIVNCRKFATLPLSASGASIAKNVLS